VLSLVFGTALALEPAAHPVTLVGGTSVSYGTPDSMGVGSDGRLLVRVGQAQVDVAAREGWAFPDSRLVGALFFGGRWSWASGVFVRAGFAHNHEVPAEVVAADPFASVLGAADGIRHRSGLAVGSGWVSQPLGDDFTNGRVRLGLDLEVSAFPDDNGPVLYTGGAGQVHLALGSAD